MGSKDFLYGTKEKYKVLAKKQGYESRSVFKLKEIDKKFNIIIKNSIILDLGYWPGGWIEYCSKKAKHCIGIDIKEPNKNLKQKNITLIQQDIFKDINIQPVDTIISDMMSKTTGKKNIDTYNSYLLCQRALEIAIQYLKDKGNLVVKMFESEHTNNFIKECKKYFKTVKIFKPKSSRPNSKETFIICKNYTKIK